MTVSSGRLRGDLVRALKERGAIRTELVESAFEVVPRELFVPEVAAERGLEVVYGDEVFVTRKDAHGLPTSSSSQPGIMAPMLEQLRLEPRMRVLEIGAGTGYNAALLKAIVGDGGRVVTVDIDPDTAREARAHLRRAGARARVIAADGRDGWGPGAPYDRIIATASAAAPPRAWFDQLRPDGILVVPMRLTDAFAPQLSMAFRKEDAGFALVEARLAGFMGLRGAPDAPAPMDPAIVVEFRGEGDAEPLMRIDGHALGRMSAAAKRRLVTLASGEWRKRRLPVRAPAGGLWAFFALAAPPARLCVWGRGLVDPFGRGLAVLVGDFKTLGSVWSVGESRVERDVLRVVREWDDHGRPGLRDLRVRIFYGKRSARAWRWSKREESIVAFDWATDPR